MAGFQAGGVVIAEGNGFEKPLRPHKHWLANLCGTIYYLCSILEGFSRFLVNWDLRESMREADIGVILERAKPYAETSLRRQRASSS